MARVDEQILDQADATVQKAKLADRLAATPVVVRAVVSADATGGQAVTIPYDMYLIDVIVQCNAANASGTLQLRNGTTAITDAIACATNHAVARAGTIDDAHEDILTTDSINLLANGAADRGTVYLIGMRY
jgi:hypothetical protein